jgi:hypothetical protein
LSNLAQLTNAYTELDLFQAPLEAAGEFYSSFVQYWVHLSVFLEADISVAGGAGSAPQASKLFIDMIIIHFFFTILKLQRCNSLEVTILVTLLLGVKRWIL